MNLAHLLDQKKTDVLDSWIKQVLEGYSGDASRIFGREKDRFANPIGYNVRQGLSEMYEALISDPASPSLGRASFELIKVRAVQEFAPSVAVAFIFLLKDIIRKETKSAIDEADLRMIDTGIDTMALQLFDHYMQCREQLFKVRLGEIKQNRFLVTDFARCPSKFLRDDREQGSQPVAGGNGADLKTE